MPTSAMAGEDSGYVDGPHEVVVIPPHTPHAVRTHDKPCLAIDAFLSRAGLAEIMQARWSRGNEGG